MTNLRQSSSQTLPTNLRSNTEYLKRLQDKLDDLLWDGLENNRAISYLESEIERVLEKVMKGELYEPTF